MFPTDKNSHADMTTGFLVILLFALLPLHALAGTGRKVVVADATSRQPIAHASLWAKEGGKFHAAITDEQGCAIVSFPFQRLTVSHLNYEKRRISLLADTIWLKPKSFVTPEVVVTSKEPEWIRPLLRRFVKNKDKLYFNCADTVGYDYESQSIDTGSVYRYHSKGLLRLTASPGNRYRFAQREGNIYSPDTLRLTDTNNLRRILYEDFVADFDAAFVRNHRFFINGDYAGKANEVQLVYRNPKRSDDHGSFVIDTARCVILRANSYRGLQSNLAAKVGKARYKLFHALTGYTIDGWTVDYHVEYQCRRGNWYIGQAGYKIDVHAYTSQSLDKWDEFHRKTGDGWGHMEATLMLTPSIESGQAGDEWLTLPRSWYIGMPYETSEENEISLSNLPAQWHEWQE